MCVFPTARWTLLASPLYHTYQHPSVHEAIFSMSLSLPNFTDEHTILNVRIIKDVRMGWEWLGGRWWRRIPTKGQLKKAGFQKAEIEDIVAVRLEYFCAWL